MGTYPPPPSAVNYRIRSTSGRYTSYWNVFLLRFTFVSVQTTPPTPPHAPPNTKFDTKFSSHATGMLCVTTGLMRQSHLKWKPTRNQAIWIHRWSTNPTVVQDMSYVLSTIINPNGKQMAHLVIRAWLSFNWRMPWNVPSKIDLLRSLAHTYIKHASSC